MATWNEISHIGANDLLFALGLRGGATWRRHTNKPAKKSRRTKDTTRRGPRKHTEGAGSGRGEDGDDLERDSDDADGDRTSQMCKAERCLEREKELEMALDRRAVLHEAHVRVKKIRAVANARAMSSETARDERLEELRDIESQLRLGESSLRPLQASLAAAKASHAFLETTMHGLSAERSRLQREEWRDSTPAHLKASLPSRLADAKRGLNFSSAPSRLNRLTNPETVFAILEDGMPGGRLETREGGMGPGESRQAFLDEKTSASSSREEGAPSFTGLPSCAPPGFGSEFGIWPTTPPRCRRRELDKMLFAPPSELPVSPIQSSGRVQDVRIFDQLEAESRRSRRLRTRRQRASRVEACRAAGVWMPETDDASTISAAVNSRVGTSRTKAWASPPSKLPSPLVL